MDWLLLVLGVALGGVFSWRLAERYYRKSIRQSQLDLQRLSADLKHTNSIEYFHYLLAADEWDKAYIENKATWTAHRNSTFQITMSDNFSDFDEKWSRGFPDSKASRTDIYLRIGGATVKELIFVSLDGGRILVPAPERILVGDQLAFFWRPDDIRFKVGKIIGSYYIYENIEWVAQRCGIEIVNETLLGSLSAK